MLSIGRIIFHHHNSLNGNLDKTFYVVVMLFFVMSIKQINIWGSG